MTKNEKSNYRNRSHVGQFGEEEPDDGVGRWEEDGVGQLEVGAEELPDEEREGDGGGDVRDGLSSSGRGGEAPTLTTASLVRITAGSVFTGS